MKQSCLEKTQKGIKISPNPSFSKRGTVIAPLAKGGKGGFSDENIRRSMCIYKGNKVQKVQKTAYERRDISNRDKMP